MISFFFGNSHAYRSSRCSSLRAERGEKKTLKQTPPAKGALLSGGFTRPWGVQKFPACTIPGQLDNSCGWTLNKVWQSELRLPWMPQFEIINLRMSFDSYNGALHTGCSHISADWVGVFLFGVKNMTQEKKGRSIFFPQKRLKKKISTNHNSWIIDFVARRPWATFLILILSFETSGQSETKPFLNVIAKKKKKVQFTATHQQTKMFPLWVAAAPSSFFTLNQEGSCCC